MPGTPYERPKPVCDGCKREVDQLRTSMWHGDLRICLECFYEWYDPHTGTEQTDPISVGNYVRKQHGLLALTSHERNIT